MNGLALKFEGVSKLYPGAAEPAVRDVSLAVEEGSFVTLLGTSGSGKTTLLKMVNRIIEPTSGSITLFGQDIRERPATELRRGIGYVIQQTGLFPHMTVEQNISTVPDILGWDKSRVSARVSELMELVQLPEDMRKRYPRQLSGGQQQRVGIARAMAGDPKVLLMDEPFGALDAITRSSLQDELLAIQRRLGRTVLFVTHDVSEAFKLGDRVVVMNGGRIEQAGTPLELLTRPATGFVRQLTGGDDLFQLLELLKAEDRMLPLSDGSLPPEPAPSVRRTDSLKSALELMLRHGASEAVVVDERGDAAGRLTLARLQPQPREGEPMSEYLRRHYDDLLKGLWEHLLLSASALAIALLIALPAGYWLSRHGRIAVPVLAVLGIVYAIPSLGMFALLIPLLGLGKQPALAALVLYSQLVLIRNVISGFRSIEPAVRESAAGAGFGRWRLFTRIELPLALPVILGGVRIASLSIIGIATIAAWINAGGLGVILFEGLYQNSVPKMVWGTVLVALLAITVNQLLLALERRSIRRAAGEG